MIVYLNYFIISIFAAISFYEKLTNINELRHEQKLFWGYNRDTDQGGKYHAEEI